MSYAEFSLENFFLAVFPPFEAPEGAPAVEAMRKSSITHEASLTYFLILCNKLSSLKQIAFGSNHDRDCSPGAPDIWLTAIGPVGTRSEALIVHAASWCRVVAAARTDSVVTNCALPMRLPR
jgi:hypothetical protein